jgi:hypothetical protein
MSSPVRDPRIDIAQTVYAFAYGIDGRDWDAYRSIFVDPDEIIFDYESYSGRPATSMTSDDWLAVVTPLFDGLDATQHTMSNPIVEIDGPTARCRMYMQAAHFLWSDDVAEPEFTIGGYYDDHLVFDGGSWKIDEVRLTVWWRRGNEGIMKLARQRGAS